MKDITDRYLDRYRRRLSDLESMGEEIRGVRDRYEKELMELNVRRSKIQNEIHDMRRIITTMVDHGCDPVEAKLRNENAMRETIWDVSGEKSWDGKISIDPGYSLSIADISVGTTDTLSSVDIGYDDGNGGMAGGYSFR